MNETGLASLEADMAWLDDIIVNANTSNAVRVVAARARASLASAYATLSPGIIPQGGEADAATRAETPDDSA